MIYLDSAATSLLKPRSVGEAVQRTMSCCASPGRGGYESARRAAEVCCECRCAAAELFHLEEPDHVVFTMNATHALNLAIHAAVRPGDRVVISCWEHNAVLRPLVARQAQIDVAHAPLFDAEGTLEAFRQKIPGAAAVVCTHVSNVFGYILPLGEIAGLCRSAGVPLIVDAAQSAGALPLDVQALDCAFAAMPGHKGLMGPQGTGLLLCRGETVPLLHGGTGSYSRERDMPEFLPERLEAGTLNVPGIAGLLEGLRYIESVGVEQIMYHEREQLQTFIGELGEEAGRLFFSKDPGLQGGVISMLPEGMDCESAAERLDEGGVSVRAGLHCAPLAHESAGTIETGTVRFSFSPLLTLSEVREGAGRCKEILRK